MAKHRNIRSAEHGSVNPWVRLVLDEAMSLEPRHDYDIWWYTETLVVAVKPNGIWRFEHYKYPELLDGKV
jgi:hypothetical protein